MEKVVLMVDVEYRGYVVDVPELPRCMSQGKTIDKALENVKDAIKGWLLVEERHDRLHENEIRDLFIGEVTG